jgi:hypothetical protein
VADAAEMTPEQLSRECLRKLVESPATHSLPNGLQVVTGLLKGMLDEATVREALSRVDVTTPGTALVAATLDRRAQEIASPHADALARMIAANDADPWWAQLEALWRVHELAYDGRALVAATRRLLVHDRYHRRTLQMAMRAAQIANEPIDAIDADLAIADVLLGPYTRLVEHPEQWQSVIADLPLPHLRRSLAWRVLQRVELDKPPAPLGAWALDQILTSPDAEAFMALVEEVASGTFVEELWHTLFDPDVRASYALPLLSDAHATRIARAMVATQLRHADGDARHAANEVMRQFTHRGAEGYVIDALTEYSVRYAAVRGAGGPLLANGQTIASQLEDLVASLYMALATISTSGGTPSARDALIERLFAERRAYVHLAAALAVAWTESLHTEILRQLAERNDARAAGAYAFALRGMLRQPAALRELTAAIVEWQGDSEVTRGYLHYALIVGMLAALAAGDIALVQRAHDAASWISDPPLEPDAHARGRAWANPLDDPELQATIAAAIAPPVATPVVAATTPTTQAKKAKKTKKKPAAKAKPKPKAKAKAKAKTKPKPKPAAKPKSKAKPAPKKQKPAAKKPKRAAPKAKR